MNIVFFGTPAFAVPSLKALVEAGHSVSLVVTNPDRRRGRRGGSQPPEVKVAALELGLSVLQPTDLKSAEFKAEIKAHKPDLGVVVAYGQYLRRWLRRWPTHGLINVHASLLPRHRGASPVSAALLAGDDKLGVTIMEVARKMDGGRVLGQAAIDNDGTHSCGSLTQLLSEMGARLLVEVIDQVDRGEAVWQPQDESLATEAGKLQKSDGHIQWTKPAAELERMSRAYHPWPLLRFQYNESPVIVEACQVEVQDPAAPAEPGVVLELDNDTVVVATGEGCLRLQQVKPAGKKVMSAGAFARGRQIKVGDRFANG